MSHRRQRNLPDFVRIKRKRNQSSLQALILEAPRLKRAKSSHYVFKLQRTDDEIVQLPSDGNAVLPLLQESSHRADKENTFVIPKTQETDELPEEFNDMLNNLLTVNTAQDDTKPLKRRKHKDTTHVQLISENVELEYVYDVYYRDKAVQESWEKENIGYIKFEEDYEDLGGEDDSDKHVSDDEDSNAEDFYQNDYPEDEDDHSTSDEDDNPNASFEKLTESLHKEAAINSPLLQADEFEELYDELYGQSGTVPVNFLASLDDDGDEDDDFEDEMDVDGGYEADEADEAEDYPRQNFFPNEEEDELAKHRDRIFGKLQKMIDEE